MMTIPYSEVCIPAIGTTALQRPTQADRHKSSPYMLHVLQGKEITPTQMNVEVPGFFAPTQRLL